MRHHQDRDSEFKEKVVSIARVTKVVKGGKKMGFRAVVVVGDMKNRVGLGIGKAAEVSAAIRKGVEAAKKGITQVPLINGSIPHDVHGKFSASKVVLRPAPRGTGVIAGGSVRTILELAGVKNIVAKKIGSANSINVARATLNGLSLLKRIEVVTKERGKEPNVQYVKSE
ncbi:30S ribosomal protein S5 [candidate division WOR-1 bacterium RIFOXYA12_FULL_52_29]|uniref:Small ribosomal subunit protein uS5 n=1 Tax=candidate division WOR-1 bacterium RIFOXYC12_FULL_54_18 TaxID=1802584 RepID=A0A1F4T5A6_UNCSA|nr:MAG: 30S ribosomal protein S5 [candidate division WOR-1 bacterium RIFOXYA2_FULL_51_19]OGC17574.1 MAG: 30S ribosomal protein S5 [candidate division WOR-1 bacterium RIFOXYA12_FULL_52_29]OGC26431.1 MAG: 30S ribosomal protein S5 [candidate division WOR-1 bacterium RIFOXYB2_FULL_45_9]OGC27991.1 MAG: 30S ribosomal protein S5 [candidate division WOR-1 bacterium RIFOXYC12_FULL_54_18]OGC29723.1 MAG: 30S ribosomal protein S5 [candidate division WOR-1 bacterium RIFOXYB12_FULL_52_16]